MPFCGRGKHSTRDRGDPGILGRGMRLAERDGNHLMKVEKFILIR